MLCVEYNVIVSELKKSFLEHFYKELKSKGNPSLT